MRRQEQEARKLNAETTIAEVPNAKCQLHRLTIRLKSYQEEKTTLENEKQNLISQLESKSKEINDLNELRNKESNDLQITRFSV